MIESSETKYINDQLVERRYQAGRPYHKPRSRHDVSRREDHIFAVVLIFVTGAMCGATVALMWVSV